MQTSARVVIVGGGIAGASIAPDILAKLGWGEIVVLEKGDLVSGTTSHAPGLVGQLRSDLSLARMLMYSVELYRSLAPGGPEGYRGEGSLRVASSVARMTQLREQAALARKIGLEAHLIGPEEAGKLFPPMDLQGVEGALFMPQDGSASAPDLAEALVRQAGEQGVAFHAHTPVTAIEAAGGEVRAVQTTAGRIATETLVVAAGVWSRLIGALAGVALPLTPMQHQYVITDPLPELAEATVPNLRDPDHIFYLRQRDESLVIGGYERPGRPFAEQAIPTSPDPTVRPFDAAQFEPVRRGAALRIPAIAGLGNLRQVNGLEAFTPDGRFLLGPAPDLRGLWAACGFCAHGVSGAGGVGRAMAQWIAHGDPGLDLSHMSLARFASQPPTLEQIQAGACQVYETYYDLAH